MRPFTMSVGTVEISTYNPVTVTGFERDTSLHVDLSNTGLAPAMLRLPDPQQIQHPNWREHLFAFQANEITLGPGGRETAERDSHAGVISVVVSEDARTIAAAYSDSTIRIFRRK